MTIQSSYIFIEQITAQIQFIFWNFPRNGSIKVWIIYFCNIFFAFMALGQFHWIIISGFNFFEMEIQIWTKTVVRKFCFKQFKWGKEHCDDWCCVWFYFAVMNSVCSTFSQAWIFIKYLFLCVFLLLTWTFTWIQTSSLSLFRKWYAKYMEFLGIYTYTCG